MRVSFVFLPCRFQASSSGGKSHAGTGSLLVYTPTKNLASLFYLFVYLFTSYNLFLNSDGVLCSKTYLI